MGITAWIDRRFYAGYERNWDDLLFRQRILDVLTPQSDVLDIGAGAGIVEAMNFKGRARMVCGIDLDPRVVDNPYLDEALVANARNIPFPSGSFDVVFADNVMEHLDRPRDVFREIHRVLRPGGTLLFKTPNRHHYMPLIARMTPHRFHQWFNRRRGRPEADTFPTVYRANSGRDIRDLARGTGFDVRSIELIEGRPEYLRISPVTYVGGLLYERLVNKVDALANFRVLLIATLRKSATGCEAIAGTATDRTARKLARE